MKHHSTHEHNANKATQHTYTQQSKQNKTHEHTPLSTNSTHKHTANKAIQHTNTPLSKHNPKTHRYQSKSTHDQNEIEISGHMQRDTGDHAKRVSAQKNSQGLRSPWTQPDSSENRRAPEPFRQTPTEQQGACWVKTSPKFQLHLEFDGKPESFTVKAILPYSVQLQGLLAVFTHFGRGSQT